MYLQCVFLRWPGSDRTASEREARGARVDGEVKVRCASKSSPDATFCPPSLRDGGGTRGALGARARNLPGPRPCAMERPTLLGKIAPRHAISLKLPRDVARWRVAKNSRPGAALQHAVAEKTDVQRGDARSNERGGSDPGH